MNTTDERQNNVNIFVINDWTIYLFRTSLKQIATSNFKTMYTVISFGSTINFDLIRSNKLFIKLLRKIKSEVNKKSNRKS